MKLSIFQEVEDEPIFQMGNRGTDMPTIGCKNVSSRIKMRSRRNVVGCGCPKHASGVPGVTLEWGSLLALGRAQLMDFESPCKVDGTPILNVKPMRATRGAVIYSSIPRLRNVGYVETTQNTFR